MLVVVSYDVSTETPHGRRRLRRVAKVCTNHGTRVQNSVFECFVEPDQWVMLKAQLLDEYNSDEDSLRFYFLGRNWQRRKEHHGAKPTHNPGDPLIA